MTQPHPVTPTRTLRGVEAGDLGWVVEFATDAGYRSIMLWTNDVLVAARRIYEAAGFGLVDAEPHHSFGHDLVGQTWSKELLPH